MGRKSTGNTFEKGLVMDLNPISTPNNVMTSALNVTMITFNGNEYVLQSDMGNGRVETAYLPSGYVPISMVEFGGIIYVASYNPFNGRGQVGSFPSPERNISSDEVKQAITVLTNNDFGWAGTTEGVKVMYVQKDLYKDKMSPGDKYIVYTGKGMISSNYKKLYEFPVTERTGDEKPSGEPCNAYDYDGALETKAVELYFATLTDEGKIVRLQNLKTYAIDGNENMKYIIPELQSSGATGIPNLDSYRSIVSSPYNVFNSKVSGKLLLIAELISINSFSASVVCKWKDEREVDGVTIKDVEIFFDMVCESGNDIFPYSVICKLIDDGNELDNKYVRWDTSINAEYDGEQISTNRELEAKALEIEGYDIENREEHDIAYTLTPCMTYGRLNHLSVSGVIQLDKVGTGYTELYEWRYYRDNATMLINWALQCYPEDGFSVAGIRFIMSCYNRKGEIETIVYNVSPKKSYAGSFSESIPLDNNYYKIDGDGQLKSDRLYYVTIEVMYGENGSDSTENYKYFYRWLYTCDIFNEKYIEGKTVDFIVLQPNLAYSANNNLSISNPIEEDEKTRMGNFFSLEKISDIDSLSITQYTGKYRLVGDISATIEESYNLFVLDIDSISMYVTCKDNENLKANVVLCDIQSTSGEVPFSTENIVGIHQREGKEDGTEYNPFNPPIHEDDEGATDPFKPDFTSEEYQNDIRLADHADIDFISDRGSISVGEGLDLDVVFETLEHVKAYGVISGKNVQYKQVIKPVLFNDSDSTKYRLRFKVTKTTDEGDIGYFIGTHLPYGCRNDVYGHNNRAHFYGGTVNPDGTFNNTDDVKNDEINGTCSYVSGSVGEIVRKLCDTSSASVTAYLYSSDMHGTNDDIENFLNEKNASLVHFKGWAYNGCATSGEGGNYTFCGAYHGKGNHGYALRGGCGYMVFMKLYKSGYWAPINMMMVVKRNKGQIPNAFDYECTELTSFQMYLQEMAELRRINQIMVNDIKNIFNAIAIMLIQIYYCNDSGMQEFTYAPDYTIYDYRVNTNFEIDIDFEILAKNEQPVILIETDDPANRVPIDEQMRLNLFAENDKQTNSEKDVDPYADDQSVINNNITFNFGDGKFQSNFNLTSIRTAESLRDEIEKMTGDVFETKIYDNNGRENISDIVFSTGPQYYTYLDNDGSLRASKLNSGFNPYDYIEFLRVAMPDGTYRYRAISGSRTETDVVSMMAGKAWGERGWKNKLYIDSDGNVYLNDDVNGESVNALEANIMGEHNKGEYPKLKGFSKFTPNRSLQVYEA